MSPTNSSDEPENITFTRSRPYRKNDSCHVEQKNYTSVRQYAGYVRYDTEEELELLNELYRELRLYLNFFHPSAKLKGKERIGSRVKKTYHPPRTPYQRMLDSQNVTAETKQKLKCLYSRLNPAELKRNIDSIQEKLWKIALRKSKKAERIKRGDMQRTFKSKNKTDFSLQRFISGDI